MPVITEEIGDVFSAPAKSILIHACNARGAWGSGVALAFKRKYPDAFRKYNAHCLSPPTGSKSSVKQHQANLVGTTLLIPPPNATELRQASKTPHYIACLFTSLDYGKRVSPPDEILHNTGNALRDLAKQVTEKKGSGQEIAKCHAVRINSGKFGVEWQKTKAVLEAGDLDIMVSRPEGEENVSVEINTRGCDPRVTVRSKAETPFTKQMRGVKRKVEKDSLADRGDGCEAMKEREPTRTHPGIAKRRKKLGFGG